MKWGLQMDETCTCDDYVDPLGWEGTISVSRWGRGKRCVRRQRSLHRSRSIRQARSLYRPGIETLD